MAKINFIVVAGLTILHKTRLATRSGIVPTCKIPALRNALSVVVAGVLAMMNSLIARVRRRIARHHTRRRVGRQCGVSLVIRHCVITRVSCCCATATMPCSSLRASACIVAMRSGSTTASKHTLSLSFRIFCTTAAAIIFLTCFG